MVHENGQKVFWRTRVEKDKVYDYIVVNRFILNRK